MAKSERLFEMLQYIREYPYLTARDLARLCNVSVRGIYRYLNTLSRSGIHVYFQDDGYRLPEEGLNLLKSLDVDDLEALRKILSIGIVNAGDSDLAVYGKKFLEIIEENLPVSKREKSDEIEIVPEWIEPVHYGGTITIGHVTKPDIINPILTQESISVTLMSLLFNCLVSIDASQRPLPDLAQEWSVSRDGLVWTFFLREDVKFHDGFPLTAHDVEFTYRAILDPNIKSLKSGRYNLIEKIETEGDYIFRVFLKRPFSSFIYQMDRSIVPKHLLENVNLYNTPFNRHPIGSGPFKFVDWKSDDTIILEANREYFLKGRPALNKLIFKSYQNREEGLEAIKRGEIDIALDLAASDLLFISRIGGFRVYPALGVSYYAMLFNLNDPLFSDIRIRKGLDYAIDKETIIKNQLKGNSEICTGPFSIKSWAYNHDVQPLPYDIETAKSLFNEVGWVDQNRDGWLEKDGKDFEIYLTVPNISDSLERIVMGIKAQLAKVGVKVKVIYINDSKIQGIKFHAMLTRISVGVDPDCVYGIWHSSGPNSITHYKNELVDELLEKGRIALDLNERRNIYNKIHKIIHDDYPAVFIASGFEYIGSSYRIRNARFNSVLHFLTTVKDWQIIGTDKKDMAQKGRREAGVGF